MRGDDVPLQEDGNVLETHHLAFSYPGIGANLVPAAWTYAFAVPSLSQAHDAVLTAVDWRADGRPLVGIPPVVHDMNVALPRGARCLMIGPNGAGKTTLLKILGGKYLLPEGMVRVLGSSPFHDTELTVSGALSYLGGNWDRDIAFAGYSIPLQVGTSWAASCDGQVLLAVKRDDFPGLL